MKASIMSYDTKIVKKGFYFDFELLATALNCKWKDIEYLGFSSTGHNVYSTPKGNIAVISKHCDFNHETRRGSFKYRKYIGKPDKLNKKYVESFAQEKAEFIEKLKAEGSQLRVPDINSFDSLPNAIACYLSVVANSIGCSDKQRKEIMDYKVALDEWIKREGYTK